MPSPIIYQQEFITADGDVPIKPWAIAQAADGGFVIAGSAGMHAWAAKTDARGKTLWKYSRPSQNNEGNFSRGRGAFYPEFLGAVPMPDGSSYLCGYMPGLPNAYAPGLIVHLDAQGLVLTEQPIVPQNRPERGIARIDQCARWGDGVVFQGHLVDWTQGFNGQFSRNDLYWLIVFDSAGKVRWEQTFPMTANLAGPDGFSPLLVMGDSSLVFSANKNESTELIRISADGEVISQKNLSGRFQIVEPLLFDEIIYMIGSLSEDVDKNLTIVAFNGKFDEFSRVKGQQITFLPRVTYQLSDHSILVFGSRAHVLGETYTSQIIHIAPGLQDETSLDPPRNRSPFFDAGSIWAAAKGSDGQFVFARGLSIGSDLNENGSTGIPRGFRRGVELDFVLTK